MYVIISYYTNFTTPTASAVDQSFQNLYFVSDGFPSHWLVTKDITYASFPDTFQLYPA